MDAADAFEPLIGQMFVTGDGRHALELTHVEWLACAGLPGRQPFTVMFRGAAEDVLPEGHHQFELVDGRVTSFHVMPIHTPGRGWQDYQAVFN